MPAFQQKNVRPHAVGIVQTFLDAGNIRLMFWPARVPGFSPTESVLSVVDR